MCRWVLALMSKEYDSSLWFCDIGKGLLTPCLKLTHCKEELNHDEGFVLKSNPRPSEHPYLVSSVANQGRECAVSLGHKTDEHNALTGAPAEES